MINCYGIICNDIICKETLDHYLIFLISYLAVPRRIFCHYTDRKKGLAYSMLISATYLISPKRHRESGKDVGSQNEADHISRVRNRILLAIRTLTVNSQHLINRNKTNAWSRNLFENEIFWKRIIKNPVNH